ncbi:MAG TPA: NAD(P)-dependent oxidoreductase [Terriglobia bacterium]|nr:NAD(P)-dependent oxidoreductase [Terriglobia bacterium]
MVTVVTGAAGLFGHGLVSVFSARHKVIALTHHDLDITAGADVRATFKRIHPQMVVHPAGTPDLDLCEADPARGFLVNFHGTRNVIEAAQEAGAAVAFVSTDAVFDGKKQTPYIESDAAIPPTVYGRTKLRAEQLVLTDPNNFVFRVSVLFGPGKTNFVQKALEKIRAGEEIVVASDQLGSATYTIDAAQKIMEVVEARRPGLYHLSNQGACTRLDIALRAAKLAGLDVRRVIGKPSGQMGRRAQRLKYAVMEMAALAKAGFAPPRKWQDALAEYIRTLPL